MGLSVDHIMGLLPNIVTGTAAGIFAGWRYVRSREREVARLKNQMAQLRRDVYGPEGSGGLKATVDDTQRDMLLLPGKLALRFERMRKYARHYAGARMAEGLTPYWEALMAFRDGRPIPHIPKPRAEAFDTKEDVDYEEEANDND